MGFVQTLRRWFGRDEDDPVDPAARAEAARIAYDRDSIRGSQQLPMRGGGGSMTPTPDVLHPDERD
jgi:hypothetical protein